MLYDKTNNHEGQLEILIAIKDQKAFDLLNDDGKLDSPSNSFKLYFIELIDINVKKTVEFLLNSSKDREKQQERHQKMILMIDEKMN